jgi:hypothetical protein
VLETIIPDGNGELRERRANKGACAISKGHAPNPQEDWISIAIRTQPTPSTASLESRHLIGA